MRILLVEDEIELASLLTTALSREGFIVDHVGTLMLAEEAIKSELHEVILLDRNLPDGDGVTLATRMRRTGSTTPIIILTAADDPRDRILGLDSGADDYVTKPFHIGELVARLRAAGRRSTAFQSRILTEGNVEVDLTTSEIRVDGRLVPTPRREVLVLKLLLRRAGHTVLRSTLEESVYGYDDDIQSNALDSHVSRLRKRMHEAGADLTIHTVRGLGYLISPNGPRA